MTNPAMALADLLETWTVPPNQKPQDARGSALGEDDNIAFWRAHGEAVALLRDLEREISALRETGHDVDAMSDALPYWYRAVFAYTTPWDTTSANPRPALRNSAHLMVLRILGGWLKDRATAPGVGTADVDAIRAALEQAYTLIRESAFLAAGPRGYLLSLIAEARACLDDIETYGTARLRSVTFELNGALHTQSVQVEQAGDTTTAEKLREVAGRLTSWFGKNAATAAITAAVTTEVTQYLPPH